MCDKNDSEFRHLFALISPKCAFTSSIKLLKSSVVKALLADPYVKPIFTQEYGKDKA